MAFETLIFEENDGIGILKINRPKAMNALNSQVLSELEELAGICEKSETLRCLVITGNHEKSFVAGADIKEFKGLDKEGARKLAERGQSVFRKIEKLKVPVIAAVNGFALGGGLELALSCDFIIASSKARFGLPEVGLGIMPGYGGTQRLSGAVGIRLAKEITYTGAHYKADAALSMGLANRVVEPEALLESCLELAKQISKQAPLGVASSKVSISDGNDVPYTQGMELEADLFGELFTSQDCVEGVTAFIEKRPADFSGK